MAQASTLSDSLHIQTRKSSALKIFIAGDWHSHLHEEVADRAFRQLGHETVRFPWHQYFLSTGLTGRLARPAYRLQNKFLMGPIVSRINRDLAARVEESDPDAVFIYRGSHVFRETLQRIREKSKRAILVGYNNDDPFSPMQPRWYWRHFLAAVPEYDLVLAYRPRNVAEFKALGARNVRLLRSWYVPERNHPVVLSEEDRRRFECDVVFTGHYEDDGRRQCLEEVVRRGWKLNLFGHDYGWHIVISKSPELRPFMPLRTVWGEDYNKAICGARVALCFLSKLNRDTYTRRCFEIPASGTLMLAEYTEDLAGLFKAGEEADFFRTPSELAEKLDTYLRNEALRARVAEAGRRRVALDGHDVESRMRSVIEWVKELQDERELRANLELGHG